MQTGMVWIGFSLTAAIEGMWSIDRHQLQDSYVLLEVEHTAVVRVGFQRQWDL